MVLKASYEYISLFSFEKFIEHNKLKYRKVLFKSLESLKTSNPDYSSWLDFFFLSIKKSLQHSKKIELLMHTFFTQNQLTIIEYSDKVNSFSLNDLEQALNIDKNKLTISLEKLVKLKIIKKEYLGTYYIYQKKY